MVYIGDPDNPASECPTDERENSTSMVLAEASGVLSGQKPAFRVCGTLKVPSLMHAARPITGARWFQRRSWLWAGLSKSGHPSGTETFASVQVPRMRRYP